MKSLFLFWSFFQISCLFGQTQDAWVYLSDKPDYMYYMTNPLEMLSQRALDRRQEQGIALDSTDVPIHQSYIDLITASDIEIKAQSKWLNALHVRGTVTNIQNLLSYSFVSSIDFADKSLNSQPRQIQTSLFKKQTDDAPAYDYGAAQSQMQLHSATFLHEQGYTGIGKVIAVIDNGFLGVDTAQPFERLHTENKILGGYNFVNRTENFYTGGSHGTQVLSVIGANLEGSMIGTAPEASFYLFITEDNTSETPLEESLWVEAAERADSLGVDIINTSLGYNTFDNPNYNYTYADMNGQTTFISRGINHAFSKGMICITSAGNTGNSSWHYITAPADAPGSFTVGAVNAQGAYVSFSSVGPTSDGRVKPDVMAQGLSTANISPDGSLNFANGTSFSAPIIAGLTACLWQAFPELSNEELLQKIRETSHLFQNPNNQLGYGVPNFYQAYQSLERVAPVAEVFKIHPNPVKDYLRFSGVLIERVEVKLYDFLGKLVLKTTINSDEDLDISYLEKGLYLLEYNHSNGRMIAKIIKL